MTIVRMANRAELGQDDRTLRRWTSGSRSFFPVRDSNSLIRLKIYAPNN